MSTLNFETTRKELIEWINSLNDVNLLNFLNGLRISRESAETDWWDNLSEDEKADIQQGLDDIEHGRTLSSSEFWRKLKNE